MKHTLVAQVLLTKAPVSAAALKHISPFLDLQLLRMRSSAPFICEYV